MGDNFDFGAYLTVCQSHSVSHMVHLSSYTWIFLAVMTVVYYYIASAIDNDLRVSICAYFILESLFIILS